MSDTAVRTRRQPTSEAGDHHQRRRRWPFLLAAALLVVVLAAGSWVIFFSSLLALRTVEVGGTDQTVAAAVRLVVNDSVGTPLARIDPDQIKAEVEAVPVVASAEVARRWPDTLVINVQARTPVAVTAANGALWLMDSAGVVYLQVEAPPAGLVTLELATPGPEDPATVAALSVLAAMTADFRATVATVAAPSEFAVTVVLLDQRQIIWGGAHDNLRKMQILPALLAQPGQIFDLSDPSLVTVR